MPYLENLRRLSGESVNLSILDQGDRVLWIEILPSPQALRVNSGVGLRVLPHCTAAGKAMLAHLPECEVERIAEATGLPRITPNTITHIDQLKQELEKIRSRGFATDSQEHWQELNCVGAPIFGPDGRCVGAISTSGPAFRFSLEKLEELGPSVMALAGEISRKLGCVGPSGFQSKLTTH
jgi:IclR family acetate operon transcriptional repressor